MIFFVGLKIESWKRPWAGSSISLSLVPTFRGRTHKHLLKSSSWDYLIGSIVCIVWNHYEFVNHLCFTSSLDLDVAVIVDPHPNDSLKENDNFHIFIKSSKGNNKQNIVTVDIKQNITQPFFDCKLVHLFALNNNNTNDLKDQDIIQAKDSIVLHLQACPPICLFTLAVSWSRQGLSKPT